MFAPLSREERSSLQGSDPSGILRKLAALLEIHHTRVIVSASRTAAMPHATAAAATHRASTTARDAPSTPRRPRAAQDLFRSMDKDGNGEIAVNELAQTLLSFGVRASRTDLEELFDHLDPDGSGGIEFRELQQAISRARRGGRSAAPPPPTTPLSRRSSTSNRLRPHRSPPSCS